MGFSWCEWGSRVDQVALFFLLSHLPFFHDFFRATYSLVKGDDLYSFFCRTGVWVIRLLAVLALFVKLCITFFCNAKNGCVEAQQ